MRDAAARILRAAIDAADPAACVRRHLTRDGNTLAFGDRRWSGGRVRLVGAGKAAATMAKAVHDLTGPVAASAIVVPPGSSDTLGLRHHPGSHPVPDAATVAGTDAVRRVVAECGRDELLVVVLSGGASSMLCCPAEGLTREDLVAVTRALLASGAEISDVNTVRKQLSAVKGGWLAALAHPAPAWVLVLSDVVGDDPSTIGSGPMSPDPTTAGHALEALRHYEVDVPPGVWAHLERRVAHPEEDTPGPGNPWFSRVHTQIVGSVADALRGAAREARKLGYTPAIVSKRTTGEALHVGASLGTRARRVRGAGPKCLLFGGETTVTLGDDPGHGGRNQEVALSAAREIAGQLDTVVFSVGTDGVDGPTDAAGAIVDGTTWARIRQAGLDPEQALRGHDAHPALAASRDLVLTGPTGTNVMDVFGILVR